MGKPTVRRHLRHKRPAPRNEGSPGSDTQAGASATARENVDWALSRDRYGARLCPYGAAPTGTTAASLAGRPRRGGGARLSGLDRTVLRRRRRGLLPCGARPARGAVLRRLVRLRVNAPAQFTTPSRTATSSRAASRRLRMRASTRRGWFYSLLAVNTWCSDGPVPKRVCLALVVDPTARRCPSRGQRDRPVERLTPAAPTACAGTSCPRVALDAKRVSSRASTNPPALPRHALENGVVLAPTPTSTGGPPTGRPAMERGPCGRPAGADDRPPQ